MAGLRGTAGHLIRFMGRAGKGSAVSAHVLRFLPVVDAAHLASRRAQRRVGQDELVGRPRERQPDRGPGDAFRPCAPVNSYRPITETRKLARSMKTGR